MLSTKVTKIYKLFGNGHSMRFPRVSDTPDRFRDGQKLCRNCEKFVSSGRRYYCSIQCMSEFNRNNTWYWVRKDVLKRDRYSCRICKGRFRKRFLDVDHIAPVRMGGNVFEKANLRTLCKDCHKRKTKLDREALGY